MSYLFNGTTSELVLSSALVTAVPLTMACFFYTTTIGAARVLLTADDGLITNGFQLSVSAGNSVIATTVATTSTQATGPSVIRANKWQTAAMVSQSATSRFATKDGQLGVENTTSKTPAGVNAFEIGTNGILGTPWSGLLAEIAVWQAALTPRELQSYTMGKPANRIRPESLLLYMPLNAQNGITDLGPFQRVFANTACLLASDHPLIERPVRRTLIRSRSTLSP